MRQGGVMPKNAGGSTGWWAAAPGMPLAGTLAGYVQGVERVLQHGMSSRERLLSQVLVCPLHHSRELVELAFGQAGQASGPSFFPSFLC